MIYDITEQDKGYIKDTLEYLSNLIEHHPDNTSSKMLKNSNRILDNLTLRVNLGT